MSLTLDYSAAHKFVREQRRIGNDVRWEGFDMVFWKPTHYGFTNTKGAFRNGRWGMETRIPVTNDGTWTVSGKNIKGQTKVA